MPLLWYFHVVHVRVDLPDRGNFAIS